MAIDEKNTEQYSGFWVSKKQQKIYEAMTKTRELKEETRKINRGQNDVEEDS